MTLDTFLNEHTEAGRSDGRPLYRYRCSEPEWEQLGIELKDTLRHRELAHLNPEKSALLVLYAAEWWRRKYEGGPWTWEGICEDLALTDTQTSIYEAVARGLQRWGRPVLVLHGHKRWLATLACEGGLPIALLRRDGTHLYRFFRAVLEHLKTFVKTGDEGTDELTAIAEHYQRLLPTSFQHEGVYTLVGELVGRVWRICRAVGELPEDNVFNWLDTQRPGWRDELPLLVDDVTADTLLRCLIREAAEISRTQTAPVRIETSVIQTISEAYLTRRVCFPPKLPTGDFESLFQTVSTEVPRRLRLHLVSADGSAVTGAGILSRREGGGEEYWALEGLGTTSGEIQGVNALGEVYLEVGRSGCPALKAVGLEGSGALGDLPWVFRTEGEDVTSPGRLLAVGSCRSSASTLLVAMPPDQTHMVIEGNLEPLQLIADTRRQLFRLQGKLKLEVPGGRVRIESGHTVDDPAAVYSFSGRRMEGLASGESVWKGIPSIHARSATGSARKLVDRELVFVDEQGRQGGGSWGRLRFQHVVDGVILTEGILPVVPPDLAMGLVVGHAKAEGQVQFQSPYLKDVGIVSDMERISFRKDQKSGRHNLYLLASDDAPSLLTIRLKFSSSCLDLKLLFPQQFTRFVRPDGRKLRRDEEVHLDHLDLLNVVATGCKDRVRLNASLKDPEHPERNLQVSFPLVSGHHDDRTLALRDVQPAIVLLLACSPHPDAYVQLELALLGRSAQSCPRIKVRRYDWVLDKDVGTGYVRLSYVPGPTDKVVVEARRMTEIGKVPEELKRTGDDGSQSAWNFDPTARQPGPWLITVRDGAWHRGRSLLWTVLTASQPGGPLLEPHPPAGPATLRAGITSDPEKVRLALLKQVLPELAKNPLHPDWALMDSYLCLCENLPPSTFDVMRAAIELPEVVALWALRLTPAKGQSLWKTLEQLPFMWELVALSAWNKAIGRYHDILMSDLGELPNGTGLVRLSIGAAVNRLAERLPTVHLAFHQWLLENGRWTDMSIPNEVQAARQHGLIGHLCTSRDEEQRAVRSRQAHDDWPQPPSNQRLRTMLPRLPHGITLPDCYWTPSQEYDESCEAVMDNPLFAAVATVSGVQPRTETILDLRAFRAFDEVYFDRCYPLAVAWLLNHLAHSNPRK